MIRVVHSTKIPIWAIAATAMISSAPAFAGSGEDLSAIRQDIQKLRQDYESKLKDLEDRLQKAQAEAEAAKASAAAAQAAAEAAQKTAAAEQQAAPALVAPRAPTSQNAFNPVIAAVLNGFYVAASHDPTKTRIPGFALGDEAQGPPRGFSIGESEVALSANIDPYMFGSLNLAFNPDGTFAVEEGYIQTLGIGSGFTLKAGRFFSGIGYMNERHTHDWSFSDAPHPNRAFLNSQYGDDGIQARWLAPTNIFLEFGAEWFRGDSFPAGGAVHNGAGTQTTFVHAGSDINDSSSWLGALSFVHASSDQRASAADIFNGEENLGIASLVYKWAPGGNPVVQNLVVSGEYFFGHENGSFDGVHLSNDHSGWYGQAVYQFMPRWSVGFRYAQLGTTGVPGALSGSTLDDLGHTPRAETGLLEFDSSEFGRLRLQYTHDNSDIRPLDEVLLQYTVIYGPHGAHRY
jgi:Skp family chaperone for outer membrane proteins